MSSELTEAPEVITNTNNVNDMHRQNTSQVAVKPTGTAITNKNAKAFLSRNRMGIIGGAIGLGVAGAVLDNEDDDLFTTAGKGLRMGLGGAAVAYGGEFALGMMDNAGVDLENMFNGTTVADLTKANVARDTAEQLAKNSESKMMKNFNRLGTGMKITGAVIAGATILDLANRARDNRQAEAMEREQERELERRSKEKKRRQRQQSFSHINDGNIAIDMFNNRIGHWKMGNAKFN